MASAAERKEVAAVRQILPTRPAHDVVQFKVSSSTPSGPVAHCASRVQQHVLSDCDPIFHRLSLEKEYFVLLRTGLRLLHRFVLRVAT
jgi:hypothetical protein